MTTPPQDQTDEIHPIDTITRSIRYWWIMVALILLGALVGLILHSFTQTVYEARVEVNFSLDYNRTGPLTQFQEDYAVEVIGTTIDTPLILQVVADQVNSQGIAISPQELAASSNLERRMYTWIIRVSDTDPSRANAVAEQWASVADEQIAQAYQHAVIADQLQRKLDSSEVCLAQLPAADLISPSCNGTSLEDLQSRLSSVSAEIQVHRAASFGLAPYLLISEAEVVPASSQPVRSGKNSMMLAGSLIGAILGFVTLSIQIPRVFRK